MFDDILMTVLLIAVAGMAVLLGIILGIAYLENHEDSEG